MTAWMRDPETHNPWGARSLGRAIPGAHNPRAHNPRGAQSPGAQSLGAQSLGAVDREAARFPDRRDPGFAAHEKTGMKPADNVLGDSGVMIRYGFAA